MKKRARLIALTMATAMILTAAPLTSAIAPKAMQQETVEAAKKKDAYKLVWSDEFKGTKLDRKVWNVETHEPGWVNAELQEYVDSKKNVYLKDGKLYLKPIRKEISSGDTNLVKNADFAKGLDGWAETIANWGGEYITEATSSTADGAVTYDITNCGTDVWHVQLKQELALEKGHKYKVSFDIESSVDRTIIASLQTGENADAALNYATIGEEQRPALEANKKQTVTIETGEVALDVDKSQEFLQFSMGQIDDKTPLASKITLSNISVVELDEAGNPVETKSYTYTSGRISTQNKQIFTYGKFECRAKVPAGQGFLPAFWLMANDENVYGQWPCCGEIDCMEVMGKDPGWKRRNDNKELFHLISSLLD